MFQVATSVGPRGRWLPLQTKYHLGGLGKQLANVTFNDHFFVFECLADCIPGVVDSEMPQVAARSQIPLG